MKKRICILGAALILAMTGLAGCKKDNSEIEYVNLVEPTELLEKTKELGEYMQKGFEAGTIPQERMDEFNEILKRVEEISQNPDNIIGTDETAVIKETLAAMASQAGAPNDLIDYFVTSDNIKEEDTEAASGMTETTESEKVPVDIAKLITDFTNLQNEASKKVETGELDMEKYADLLSKGVEIAGIKEQFENGGATDELAKQAENLKPYLYDIAEAMNSDLKDNFK